MSLRLRGTAGLRSTPAGGLGSGVGTGWNHGPFHILIFLGCLQGDRLVPQRGGGRGRLWFRLGEAGQGFAGGFSEPLASGQHVDRGNRADPRSPADAGLRRCRPRSSLTSPRVPRSGTGMAASHGQQRVLPGAGVPRVDASRCFAASAVGDAREPAAAPADSGDGGGGGAPLPSLSLWGSSGRRWCRWKRRSNRAA